MWLSRSSALQQPLQPQNLLDDLAARQIPLQPIEPARAEHAAHAATNLRADANRPPHFIPQQHTLNLPAIRQPEQQLLRAIVRLRVPHHAHRPQRKLRRQLAPQRLPQIGHLLKIARPPRKQPLPNLLRPIRTLTPRAQPRSERVINGIEEMDQENSRFQRGNGCEI